MARFVEISVRVENLEVVRGLIDDSYESICSLMSESWDVLSDETKREASDVLDRLRKLMP